MIHSLTNTKVKLARALHRRAVRQREGLVIAEGARLIEEILRTGVQPVLSFCTEAGRQDPRVANLSQDFGWSPLLTTPAVMKAMSDTVSPPGLLAVFPMPRLPIPTHSTLRLVLDQVREPGNVGTILRAALAAGVDAVLLAAGSGDAFNPKSLRAGMGAHYRLPIAQNLSWDEIRAALGDVQIVLADPHAGRSYEAVDWLQPSALIVGGEAFGAGRQAMELSHQRVAIPMGHDVESLNTAVATGIILFEAASQRRKAHED